mmetsp:Transcript_20746/g.53499  ORF Transcript_20746/g.53499 Transcript_20746/m.53499 type:complete len:107 (+) Transcript_20746:202-522(+)
MEDLERSATGKKEIEEALSTYTPPVGRGDSGKGKNRKRSRPDAKGDEDGPKRQISRSASLTSFGSSDSEQLSLQPSREPSRVCFSSFALISPSYLISVILSQASKR